MWSSGVKEIAFRQFVPISGDNRDVEEPILLPALFWQYFASIRILSGPQDTPESGSSIVQLL
jgi:hypothetical protein